MVAPLPTPISAGLDRVPLDGGRVLDFSPANRGIQQAASALQDLAKSQSGVGKGLGDLAAGIAEEQMDKQRFEYATAHADALTGLTELATQFQNDTGDPNTRTQRFAEAANSRVSQASGAISSDPMKQRFTAIMGENVAKNLQQQNLYASKDIRDGTLATLDVAKQYYIDSSVKSNNPVIQQQNIDAYNSKVDAAVADGRRNGLSQVDGMKFKRDFANQYAIAAKSAAIDRAYQSGDSSQFDQLEKDLRDKLGTGQQQETPTPPPGVKDQTGAMGVGYSWGKQDEVKGYIIHHTGGGGTVDGVINTLKQRGLGAQYVIDREGTVHQLMPDGAVGRQMMNGWGKGAGLSNRNTIGVEVIARDDKDVLPVQVAAAQQLGASLGQKYGFDPAKSTFGHGEVNPGHKEADEGATITAAIRGQSAPTGESKPGWPRTVQEGNTKVAQNSPTGTATDAPQPAGGKYTDYMTTAQAGLLLDKLRTSRNAMFLDQQRQDTLEKRQAQMASEAEQDKILRDIYSPNPTTTAQGIANNDTLSVAHKENMIGVLSRVQRPEPDSKVSAAMAKSLVDAARKPDGDPLKLTNLAPVYDAYTHDKLSKSDFEFVRKEVMDARTDEGQRVNQSKDVLFKAVRPQLDKSLYDPLDTEGPMRQLRFEQDVSRKVEQYRKDGKPWQDLFDYSKPDFVGKAETIRGYQTSLQQKTSDDAQKKAGQPPLAATPLSQKPAAPAVPARNANESLDDWMKRTNRTPVMPTSAGVQVPNDGVNR